MLACVEIGWLVQNPTDKNKTERPRELYRFIYLGKRQIFHLFLDPFGL